MVTIDIRPAVSCAGDYAMFVSFPYNETLVNFIRDLPDRKWNKDTKEWEVSLRKFSAFVDLIASQRRPDEVKIVGNLSVFDDTTKTVLPDNIPIKTEPYEHQKQGILFGLSNNAWLLADEQGLGKTKQTIDIAVAKKTLEGFKHCLIVCGVNGLKWNWVAEIYTHSNEKVRILGERRKGGKIVIGSIADRTADAKRIKELDEYFLVTNVESLRNAEFAAALSKACKDGDIDMVAIDEIHKCKNPSSQQGKGILKLQPAYRMALTGTPIMNRPLDLFIVLKWLGYEKHAFYAFRNYYCVMGGYGGYEVIGYRHMDELESQLHDIMLRRLKEEVLDLPEKVRVSEYVDMTAKQALVYKEARMNLMANIDRVKASNNPLAEMIRLRQATGYTGILSSEIRESAKLDRMEELVEEALSNDKKVVIFSNWTSITDEACDRLLKTYPGAVTSITGETSEINRDAAKNRFQSDPNCKIIVGTIGAMGTGLTLTAGTVEIFLDEPWNMALKEQAEDRCHRIGTKTNITIYTLMCKDTIDERIHQLVEQKGLISAALVDGKVTGNKEEIINFLLN